MYVVDVAVKVEIGAVEDAMTVDMEVVVLAQGVVVVVMVDVVLLKHGMLTIA